MAYQGPISAARERRRERRARWAFNHELDAYTRTLSRLERPAGVPGGNPSDPMPVRAARELPRMRREHRKFVEATVEIEQVRASLLRRLEDPRTPRAAVELARPRFDQLAAHHPTPERIASQEARWAGGLARIERWAKQAPVTAA
jgi:hypothetical protein